MRFSGTLNKMTATFGNAANPWVSADFDAQNTWRKSKLLTPAELARRQRAETMAAIREGRLPEARTYLREPGRAFRGMDRGASVALVDRLYEAGARQVYVGVDFAEAPEEAHGLAISMPLTATRRRAVEAALRAQVPAPPAGQEWWLVELE